MSCNNDNKGPFYETGETFARKILEKRLIKEGIYYVLEEDGNVYHYYGLSDGTGKLINQELPQALLEDLGDRLDIAEPRIDTALEVTMVEGQSYTAGQTHYALNTFWHNEDAATVPTPITEASLLAAGFVPERQSVFATAADLRLQTSIAADLVLVGGGVFCSDRTTGHTASEDDGLLTIVDGAGRLFVKKEEFYLSSPLIDPTVTDWAPVFNQYLAKGYLLRVGPGDWNIQTELVFKRGGGIISNPMADRYPDTSQNGGRVFTGTRIRWTGPATSGAMLRMSALPVGQGLLDGTPNAFSDSVFGCSLVGITVDGNGLADFGLYQYRGIDCLIQGNVFTGTLKNAAWGSALYSGEWSNNIAFKNDGRGLVIGMGFEDFGSSFTEAEANALRFISNNAVANGRAGEFDDGLGAGTANTDKGAGIMLNLHRGNFIHGNTSELNDGPSFWIRCTSSSNSIMGLYSELANSIDIDGGGPAGTAISEGRAKFKWDLWMEGTVGGFGNIIRDGVWAGGWIRLTGVEPSVGRKGEILKLENMHLGSGVKADWGGYALINCSEEFMNFDGSTPPSGWAGSVNGRATFSPDIVCSVLFEDDGTGVITIHDSKNVTSVSRGGSAGTYAVNYANNLSVPYLVNAQEYKAARYLKPSGAAGVETSRLILINTNSAGTGVHEAGLFSAECKGELV